MDPSQKKSILKDTLRYGIANYIVQAIGIINSIALRRFMGPWAMGIWSILQVILGYCGYASFGTTKALMRDYPYLRGRGEHEKAESLKDLVLTFSMLGSLIPFAAILIYLLLKWQVLESALRVGLGFIAGFLFIQRFYDLLMALLRSDKKFTVLSQLIVLNAVAGLACTFLLVGRWNLYGLLAGTALVTVGSLFFIGKASPYHFRYFWNGPALWKELRLGIPLVAISFLSEFLKSLDKLIIAKQLGFYEVGLYSLAMMANSYIFALPMMFAHVWYPNLQEEYGRRGDAAGIKNYLLTPVFALSILSPFLCGLAVFLVPLLAEIFLPKFLPGIGAMKIYLVGSYFLLLAQFGGNFLVTLDKYWVNVPLLLGAIPLNYFLNLFFLGKGWGLEGVALGSTISFAIYGLGSYAAALRPFARPAEIFTQLGKVILIAALFFGGVFLIDRLIDPRNEYAAAVLKTACLLAFSSPFFLVLERKTGLLARLGEIMLKRGQT